MEETWIRSLGWEDPLGKGKATHPSNLAWRIPRIVWSIIGSQRVGHDWATFTHSLPLIVPSLYRISATQPRSLSSKRNLDKEFLPSASAELPVREMLQYSLDEAKESAKLEIPPHVSFLAPTPIHSDTQPTKSCSFSNQNSTREEYHSVFPMSVKRKPLYKDKGSFSSHHRLPVFWNTFHGPFSAFPESEKKSHHQAFTTVILTARIMGLIFPMCLQMWYFDLHSILRGPLPVFEADVICYLLVYVSISRGFLFLGWHLGGVQFSGD